MNETTLYRLLSRILLGGVILAVVVMLVALLAAAASGSPLPSETPQMNEIIPQVLSLQPSGFVGLGFVILFITPIATVIAVIIVLAWRRDWLYSAVAGLVFIGLVVSIVLARS